MRFLPDERLYLRTEECLEWLRGLSDGSPNRKAEDPELVHVYWEGEISSKQALMLKSFLATQDLGKTELWVWLDDAGYLGFRENPFLRPYLTHLQIRRFDMDVEAEGTPLEGRPELCKPARPSWRANPFRYLVLFKHGGSYLDVDMMLLRDIRDHPFRTEELCYQWSTDLPYGNNAFMRMRQGSDTAVALMNKCVKRETCRSRDVLRFEDADDLDLLVLPCAMFDPLWPLQDRRDVYEAAPIHRFKDFFQRFGWRLRRDPAIRSYRDFFPGAFAYHWHNLWDASEHRKSYFGLFDSEFDMILHDRLGIVPPAR